MDSNHRFHAAVRHRHDPGHLYLGSRFAWRTSEAVEACARWCDVVSFNLYQRSIVNDREEWARFHGLGKPALIGEFHFGSTRFRLKRSGMTLVPVYPFDCQDNGSARAFHECARIAADFAHKALAPFHANSVLVVREGRMVRIRLPPAESHANFRFLRHSRHHSVFPLQPKFEWVMRRRGTVPQARSRAGEARPQSISGTPLCAFLLS